MNFRRTAFLLPLLLATACASPKPYATTVGVLQPGSTMHVAVSDAILNVFAPANGEPSNRFTVEPTARDKTTPPAPKIRPLPRGLGITIAAPDPLAYLLVRVPEGVTLVVDSKKGDVHVTNISGNATITAGEGNVTAQLQGYAQASAVRGTVSVTMGATQWPGTLRFSAGTGDVEVVVNETAKFSVLMHTGDGTLFSDFGLHGTSQGKAETIEGPVNGGGPRRIEITTNAGAIRLLKLHPEA